MGEDGLHPNKKCIEAFTFIRIATSDKKSSLTQPFCLFVIPYIYLQPSGEWFVKGRNGKMWWGGTSDDFDDLMDYLEESERSPTFVDFGQYNAYFVTHE